MESIIVAVENRGERIPAGRMGPVKASISKRRSTGESEGNLGDGEGGTGNAAGAVPADPLLGDRGNAIAQWGAAQNGHSVRPDSAVGQQVRALQSEEGPGCCACRMIRHPERCWTQVLFRSRCTSQLPVHLPHACTDILHDL